MRVVSEDNTAIVGRVASKKDVEVSRPKRIVKGSMRSRVSFSNRTAYMGFGGTSQGAGGNFYSPELSTDFLELPQSIDEQRNYFRHFYENEPFVAQAIDLHTELPLSKIRLGMPEADNRELAEKSLRFCTKWAKRIGLLHRLIEIVHDYHLIGEVYIFTEDNSPEMPRDIYEEQVFMEHEDGEVEEVWKEREDAHDRMYSWLKKNYTGWTAIRVIPPEQVKMESFPFTEEKIMELIPDSKTKGIINSADQGQESAQRVVDSMSPTIVGYIREGKNIPLPTNPDEGSFVHYLCRKKSQYEARGKSLLQRVLRTLVYRDKLRQAQTSISSRHMTPMRLVSLEGGDEFDVEEMREHVDLALADPDYSIVTNFKVDWEEITSNQRLLDLGSEYDLTDRQMYAGLGVTESMLSGESSYSGDRINLEVINTRYMLLREILQDLVEEQWLKPMCRKMGFVEEDEDGDERVIYPKLSFTRLAIRDNSDTFDQLFNLYQKGSLDISVILDLLNIDPLTTRERLEKDMFTMNDATFNETLRSAYNRVGDFLVENTDLAERIAKNMGLKVVEKPDEDSGSGGGGRW
jgi:hypothetical protein